MLRFLWVSQINDIKNSPKKELDEIIALADQALYTAKKGGRNKVIVANDSF